ncbi:MAG: hypothetical protein K5664_00195 [Firmicutes bacterium]|nr:hypothetical protein [Bacillota bacterium]
MDRFNKRDLKQVGVNDSPADCQSHEPAFPQKRNPSFCIESPEFSRLWAIYVLSK